MTRAIAAFAAFSGALAGLLGFLWIAPEYVLEYGFPLDDAWIHAVYGRSLAGSWMLAYNPGIPATGATSLMWAVVLALPHVLFSEVDAAVLSIKLLGLTLHTLTAVVLVYALCPRGHGISAEHLIGPLVVALHPDLVAASLSGMEVPLASLAICALLLSVRIQQLALVALLSALAPLARPELAVPALLIAVGVGRGLDVTRRLAAGAAAATGVAIAVGIMVARNLMVSGRPLPATFYAKAGTGDLSLPLAELVGFRHLLGHLPVVDSSILLVLGLLAAGRIVLRRAGEPDRQAAAAAFLAGLAFCAVSFALVQPADPNAFYHQRYILPVLPLLVGALPLLARDLLEVALAARSLQVARIGLAALLIASIGVHAPVRYQRLANDARNTDDLQVAMGLRLAGAPPDHVHWAVDAGAVRYFGNAFVVDLIGLNSDEILGPHAQQFLDAHRPNYLDIALGWSRLDEAASQRLPAVEFSSSTVYTVTSFASMARRSLAHCDDPTVGGRILVRHRVFLFHCADP